MKLLLRRLGWLIVLCCSSSAFPADQYSEMAQGLRERQYFDYALLYLDQLATRTDLPADVRQMIPYEKAMVLLDSSKATRLPEEQVKQLDQATAFLEQFAKESPNHPKAGDANAQRAEILLGKARVEIQQSRSPANQETRSDFQSRARTLIAQARQVFETARDQHEAAWQSFGTFVNQEKEPDKYEAREQALMQLISAMLNVCQCRYEEAQTHDPGSPEFKKLLNQAAEEFEQLHQRYRNYTGGLYARLYEGKCFDDQGDTQKAMGIYNELLDHDGSNKNLRKLQHKTLQFKLEALNRKAEPDSQVVVDLAAEWLKNFKSESRTQAGLAIQWEQAVALEALGDQRDLSKDEKARLWRAARTTAKAINEIRSPYSDVSLSMLQRLAGKLGSKDRKPDNFDDAQGLANQHFKNIQDLRKELEVAKAQGKPAEDIQKIEQDLRTEMSEAAELFQLALNLADKNDDPKAVATARLWYAYVHFWARRNYEAAILAEFVAKTAPKDESTLAIDAAYLSMAGYVQAYNDTKGPVDHKMADLGFVIKACEAIIARWPESDRANDAKLMAGKMYVLAKKPEDAAKWFSKVPEADTRFPEAQMAAGQAFWDAYRAAMRMPPELRLPADQLQKFQTTAQQHLRTGIAKLTATLPKEGLPPPELMDAKFSLAAMLINQGQETDAIAVLTADPQSVVKTVTVSDEAARPAEGVQKRAFAVEVYKLLLRAYVGSSKLDDARATMKTLETVAAGGSAGADVTELYVDLGRKLKTELDDYRAAGQTDRFDALRTSFETFLNDIYQRKEGQSVGTLSWIGETYSALGEAAVADPAAAASYFDKAANALQEILRMTEANASFATTDQLVGVKTRLIHALRMKKEFPAAEKLAGELLKERKDDLNLQIETARLYQDWAAEPGEEKRFRTALGGNIELGALGFVPISKRLHGLVRGNRKSELYPIYLEMRYQTSLTRYRSALAQTNPKDKRNQLDNADAEIQNFARATRDVPDEVRAKFNTLFRDVRTAMNEPVKRPVVDLEFTADLQIDPPPETAGDVPKSIREAEKETKETLPDAAPVASPLLVYGLLGGGVAVGLALIGLMIARSNRKPKPLLHPQAAPSMNFDFVELPAAPKPKPLVSVGALREKKASGSASAVASPPAPATAAKPKPKVRPKPPPEG